MTWNYQIFKFTTHDWEGMPMVESRTDAPLYGLFEVFRNDQGKIWGRTQSPELIFDTYLEDNKDPAQNFRSQLTQMLADIELPILEEPYDYAESDVMTEEEAEDFIADCNMELKQDDSNH